VQGIAYCGVCGRKMSVQNRAAKDHRSPSYICGRGYQAGDEKVCQSMTSRPVDAAVVEAFLAAVSPISLRVATQVLDQVEQDLFAQQRQSELQLEQARYEARLVQRKYDAVDPPKSCYPASQISNLFLTHASRKLTIRRPDQARFTGLPCM
jgi:Recombinase zinc beta ribbon domain